MFKSNGYSLEDDLQPIIKGEVVLPNFEEMPLDNVVNNIASGGHMMLSKWGYSRQRAGDCKQWTQFFLCPAGMGRALDGTGYALIYGSPRPIVGKFAICVHEAKAGADARPHVGWHPAHCVKCGLDMTVDSGD